MLSTGALGLIAIIIYLVVKSRSARKKPGKSDDYTSVDEAKIGTVIEDKLTAGGRQTDYNDDEIEDFSLTHSKAIRSQTSANMSSGDTNPSADQRHRTQTSNNQI